MAAVFSSGHAGLAVPIFVSIDRDGGARVQEEVLWSLGGAHPASHDRYVPEVAAQRLCGEIGVLGSGAEKLAKQQIQDALRLYPATLYNPSAGRVQIQAEVQLHDRLFRDEIVWDLGDPQNTPVRYASAVCCDLGLGWDDAAKLAAAIEEQLKSRGEGQMAAGVKSEQSSVKTTVAGL